MFDWLGPMFKGIGDTFTAGASVNVAKMNRQIAMLQYKSDLMNADNDNANLRLQYVNAAQQQQPKLLAIALAACIIVVVMIAILRK